MSTIASMRTIEDSALILLSESEWNEDCLINNTRTPSQPYPNILTDGCVLGGHRIIWEYFNGHIPKGHHIHHKCQNQRCLRLSHLECVSASLHNSIHKRFEECPVHNRTFHRRTRWGTGICKICQREKMAKWRKLKKSL